jgi:5'-3' exonuclease
MMEPVTAGQPALLVDGDGLLYRCGFAVEKARYLLEINMREPENCYVQLSSMAEVKAYVEAHKLEEGGYELWSRRTVEPVQNALFLVNNVFEKLAKRYPGYAMEVYLTPSVGNFREQIAKTYKYKGNRDAQQRPKHYKEIAQYLIETYGAVYAEGMEADDSLGIRCSALGDQCVVVSLDKDLDQIPGKHYDWVKEHEYDIGKKEGTINFYSQVLSGDATDNIHGLTGVGPVKARKLLSAATSSKDCWEVVRSAYRGEFGELGEERAIENARLCWVRRKDAQIWQPPA